MARRLRKQSTMAKPHPVDPVYEMINRLTEPPPPYPGCGPKSNRSYRKSRQSNPNYNLSKLHIKRSSDGSGSDQVSFEIAFGLTEGSSTTPDPPAQPTVESNGLINFLLPMMMVASEVRDDGYVTQKSKKNKHKKAASKEDDPYEAYAKKLWEESISDAVSCPCRKGKLLEALQKDHDTLEQNEMHLRAQIGSYKMFQSVMSDEFQKHDVGVVMVVGEDSHTGRSELKYKLEKKSAENCGDIEALGELMKQLQAYL